MRLAPAISASLAPAILLGLLHPAVAQSPGITAGGETMQDDALEIVAPDETMRIDLDAMRDLAITRDQLGQEAISFCMNEEDGERFGRMTARHVGAAIELRFRGELVTAPVVRTPIPGGCGLITGADEPQNALRAVILDRERERRREAIDICAGEIAPMSLALRFLEGRGLPERLTCQLLEPHR